MKESLAKDFIMSQKGDRTWRVGVGPLFTSGGTPLRMVYILWLGERIAKIRAPAEQMRDNGEAMTERIYALYAPYRNDDYVTNSEVAKTVFTGWWYDGALKDIIDGKLLLGESSLKDFLDEVHNDWTFHFVGRDPADRDAVYLWIQCNGEAVYYWAYDTKEGIPLKQAIPKVKAALEAADRKEPFNPMTANPWKGEEFVQWLKRTGTLGALNLQSAGPAIIPESDARDFIMQQNPPNTWGELKIGDMLHSENGAVIVVTHQLPSGQVTVGTRSGYLHEPSTFYDEYNPCYAYTDHGGPFVQHHSRTAKDPIVGEFFIGTRSQHPGDLWALMRKLNAKRWPDQCSEAINVKKFIQRQPDQPYWKFKVEQIADRGFDKYRTRIYFNGEEVALTYTGKRPRLDSWKRRLEQAHTVLPFNETDNSFWDWLEGKHHKRLMWYGFAPTVQESEVKDFIMALPTVEAVCQQFGLKKTDEEYKNGEQLWPNTMSLTIRRQKFEGTVPLGRPIENMTALPIEVGYWEDKFGDHTVRIDVGMGGRRKQVVRKDEVSVAERTQRHLKYLFLGLKAMRSTRYLTLQRVLASMAYYSR